MGPLLKWISTHYGHPEIIVTENGYQSKETTMNDVNRIAYTQVSAVFLDASFSCIFVPVHFMVYSVFIGIVLYIIY